MQVNFHKAGYSRREFSLLLASASAGCLSLGKSVAETVKAKPLVTDFGVCTSHKNFAHLKASGYAFVEDGTRRLLKPDQPDDKVAASLDKIIEQKIRIHACNSFLPASLRSTGDNANHEGVLKYADVAFRRAKKIGVKGIVFGSSGSRKLPEGYDRAKAEAQFVALLKKMAPLAHAQGVEVWLEPLNRKEDNFINTQVQGAAIVEKVGHPALGIVCDIYHVARNEETPEDVQKCVPYMRHCHIAEKAARTAPGIEQYDFKPYLRALKSGGFSGTMSMECRWKNMKEHAPVALQYIKNQINSL